MNSTTSGHMLRVLLLVPAALLLVAQDTEQAKPTAPIERESFEVALEIDTDRAAWMFRMITFESATEAGVFDRYDGKPVLVDPGETIRGRGPDKLMIEATRLDNASGAYSLLIDRDGDGSLDDEQPLELKPNTEAPIMLTKKIGDDVRELPFRIAFDKRTEEETRQFGDRTIVLQPEESFRLATHFVYRGQLKIDDHAANITIWDLNLNGRIDKGDFDGGTALNVDPSGDEPTASLRYEQAFHFADRFLFASVQSMPNDCSSITFETSTMHALAVGEALPFTLSMKSANDSAVTIGARNERLIIIDFWASWCVPCVKTLPRMRAIADRYRDQIDVVYYSTDWQRNADKAHAIADEYELPGNRSIIASLGMEDPLWQMFGMMPEIDYLIPAHVAIDESGKVVFAHSGDLDALEQFLEQRFSDDATPGRRER